MKLTEKQLELAAQCGFYSYPFSKVFLAMNIDFSFHDAAEVDFYTAKTPFNTAYQRGKVTYDMQIDSLLHNALKSTDKEVRALDKAAYDALTNRVQANIELYEAEKRKFERNTAD